jgi:hypothetical protein
MFVIDTHNILIPNIKRKSGRITFAEFLFVVYAILYYSVPFGKAKIALQTETLAIGVGSIEPILSDGGHLLMLHYILSFPTGFPSSIMALADVHHSLRLQCLHYLLLIAASTLKLATN